MITWDGAAWAQSTPYALNSRVVNAGNVYGCTVAGTSSNSGTGPSGTGGAIADGSVTWAYLGAWLGFYVTAASVEIAQAGIALPVQTVYLTAAEELVADPAIWLTPKLLDMGRMYLAGHFAQLAQLRGHGPTTSEAVGPISTAFAALMGPRDLDLTTCGRMYDALTKTTPATFGLVI